MCNYKSDVMVEIERKYLINTKLWNPSEKGTKIKQGYLSVDPERVVRVRVAGEKAYITIKGIPKGIVRTELEYGIPKNEAEVLLMMCLDFPIEKTRFKESIGNIIWEIDVFEGENKGLVLAEVELADENQKIDLPNWAGEEVSLDSRYYNAWLSRNPFSKW
ncbi:MAG: CYTH domain-containing protein [Draconibacterium sp.]|nr:CYTH domain-containing protein [Draconibacterium sp.]